MRAVEEEFAMTYITSYEELARAEERREIVLDLLAHKFGPLDDALQVRVQALSYDQLLLLSRALLDFTSDVDLHQWLDQQIES
jgi:hypothetical protein